MILVQRMVSESSVRPAADQVELIAERRLFLKRRWRAAAADGTDFGFDLESRLKHGCVIYQSESLDYVILQQKEDIYELHPESAGKAAVMGWKIGNLHLPVQIIDGVIRVSRDPAVLQLIEGEGWPFTEVSVVFEPLRVIAHAS